MQRKSGKAVSVAMTNDHKLGTVTSSDVSTARAAEYAARQHRWAHARHATLIGYLKLGIPLLSAVIIAMVIAWPRFERKESGFTLAFHELADYAGTLKMEKPRITGTDPHNRPFVITADEAIQQSVDFEPDHPGRDRCRHHLPEFALALRRGRDRRLPTEADDHVAHRPGDPVFRSRL